MNTCRACKRYQMRVLGRLRKQLPPPIWGTPCDCCGRAFCKLELDHDHGRAPRLDVRILQPRYRPAAGLARGRSPGRCVPLSRPRPRGVDLGSYKVKQMSRLSTNERAEIRMAIAAGNEPRMSGSDRFQLPLGGRKRKLLVRPTGVATPAGEYWSQQTGAALPEGLTTPKSQRGLAPATSFRCGVGGRASHRSRGKYPCSHLRPKPKQRRYLEPARPAAG